MFEEMYQAFWEEQVRHASGQRLEMLHRDLTGTKKMLEMVLFPVFGTLDGLVLEHEMSSLSGVTIFGDVYHHALRIVFEEEHFVTHAEKITRDRFSFERVRARSAANMGLIYYPYSRDELEKKAPFCQRNLYELIGRAAKLDATGLLQLPVYEREVLRCALLRNEPFGIADACEWLQLKEDTCRKILRSLESKKLLVAIGGSKQRCHKFKVTERAILLLYR